LELISLQHHGGGGGGGGGGDVDLWWEGKIFWGSW